MLENNWVTSQYPRMGNISSKFPGGSLILPLLNNFVFLRPINSINYCKWFTLAKKSMEISGGNQSLLNLNLSYSVNSIFFPCTFIHMPVLLYILTSSTSPISINITGFSFQLYYLIQESGFDLTKLTSFKILTFYKLSVHFFFIKLLRVLIVHGSMWSQQATDGEKSKNVWVKKMWLSELSDQFFTTGQGTTKVVYK